MTWIAPPVTRTDEPFQGTERQILDGFLDWQRDSLLLKCAGLDGAALATRALPPSELSLLGLVRHLAEVERTWFRIRFAAQNLPPLHLREDVEDAAFTLADPTEAEADYARLVAEQNAAREAVAGLALDDTYVSEKWGTMTLRWAYSHMTAEYARHCGHADLLREQIDGSTGA